uniref:tRNA (guanine(9)-N(1))-methyltransferase n=1 Tax=Crassostrea virginica TaxID=6565 RepID=A0A8B8CN81_CRAVI|nr:tRNA (guanine(9)-N1)-methyltransferase-like isoform X2 [Crassostrea virginica]
MLEMIGPTSQLKIRSAGMESVCDNTESPKEETEETPLSATMSKKQLRRQQRQEKWLSIKAEVRAKEKQRKKQKRREALERGDIMAPTRKKLRSNTMAKSSCQTSVVIDCSLDSYMGEKDIMKLVKQIQFCYSSNRRSQNPMQFFVTGVHGHTESRLKSIGDYQNWDVNFTSKDYCELFEKKDIVYLSSESDNVLQELDPEKAYIIGGLVDHNHHKGLCHSLAVEKGVGHAQLPISEYLDMKTRKVLTINHVFDILLKYTETKDWLQSFCAVLPQRKGAQARPGSKASSQADTQTDTLTDTRAETQTADGCVGQNSDSGTDCSTSSTGNSAQNDEGENHENSSEQSTNVSARDQTNSISSKSDVEKS